MREPNIDHDAASPAGTARVAAGSGGDATLLVPTHEVDLPTYGRAASPRLDNVGASRPGAPTGTPAHAFA